MLRSLAFCVFVYFGEDVAHIKAHDKCFCFAKPVISLPDIVLFPNASWRW